MQKAYNIMSKIAKIVNLINHIIHAVFSVIIVGILGCILTNILKKQYQNGKPTLAISIVCFILAPGLFGLGWIAGALSIACAIIGKKLPAEDAEYEVEEIAE